MDWDYQRRAARRAVRFIRGVYSVENRITLKARPSADDTAQRIRKALVRSAQIDAETIGVKVSGNKVVLTGQVRSWPEKQQADKAAWASPQVTEVDNQIVVRN